MSDKKLQHFHRGRRLRTTPTMRDLRADVMLSVKELIYPLFIVEGSNIRREMKAMPGVFQLSADEAVKECSELLSLGISSIIIFGIPKHKDGVGTEAYNEKGVVQQAVRAIKKEFGASINVITDVCLCEFTDHGHCGILDADKSVNNDATLTVLAKEAVSHAEAGADIVAPSDMMDGRVLAIREALDANKLTNTAIMSYSVKYASAYYGPFREVAESGMSFGDRKGYQMDYRNKKEAHVEAMADIAEGADYLMVKPALAYLDIIQDLTSTYNHPIGAYNVSGEYSMIKFAAQQGLCDYNATMLETLFAIKRAGANFIITYFAKDFAKLKI